MKCVNCEKRIPEGRRKFCSNKCNDYYYSKQYKKKKRDQERIEKIKEQLKIEIEQKKLILRKLKRVKNEI